MRTSLFLISFLVASFAHAKVYFPAQQKLSERCIAFNKAMHAATQRMLGEGHVIKGSEKAGGVNKANEIAYRLGANVFITLTCNSKKGHTISFKIQAWKVVPSKQFAAGSRFKIETSAKISLSDPRDKNGTQILIEMRKILKPLISPSSTSTAFYKGTAKPKRIDAAYAGGPLPIINNVLLYYTPGNSACSSYQYGIRMLLKEVLKGRLIVKSPTKKMKKASINAFAYRRGGEAIILLRCNNDPEGIVTRFILSIVEHPSTRHSAKSHFSKGVGVLAHFMPTPKIRKAMILASRIRSVLEKAKELMIIREIDLTSYDYKKMGKKVVNYMPINSLNEAQRFVSQRKKTVAKISSKPQKRAQQKPQKPKVVKVFVPVKQKNSRPQLKFPLYGGVEAGGMMFFLGQATFLGCASGHIMYKPYRIGAMGGACLGGLPGKQGFDLFAFGGLSFLIADIPRVMNMTISASIAFHYYASELQEYGDKGTVPFWALMGVGLFVDTRFRPHQFLSFGVKMGWHPGLYEQRTLQPSFSFAPFSLQIYVSM